MKHPLNVFLLILLGFVVIGVVQCAQGAERPICTIERDAKTGKIERSSTVTAHFRRAYPCPVVTLTNRCVYFVEHVHALGMCGADHPSNLAWASPEQHYAKGRWELTAEWRTRLAQCTIDARRIIECPIEGAK